MREQLRGVYAFYRHNRIGVLVALGLTIVASLMELATIALYYPIFALFTGAPVGDGMAGRVLPLFMGAGRPTLLVVLSLLVGLTVLRAVCLYAARVVSNRYELRFQLWLKREFLRRFAESSWAFVIRTKSGALLNVFTQYTGDASRGLFCLLEFLIDVVTCMAYLAFALYVSPALAVFVIAAGLFVAPVMRAILGRIRTLVDERIVVQNALADKFLEYFRGFRTFKSMALERLYLAELDRDLLTFTRNARRSYRVQIGLASLSEPLFAVIGAAFLLVAYYGFRVGVETVVIFFALLARSYSRLSSLQVNLGRLIAHVPAIRACEDFESLAAAAAEPRQGGPLEGPIRSLALEDVHFAYPDGTIVLSGVTMRLDVERGLIALVGPSGAGKSTLLDLLSALLRPTAGVYRINGIDVRELELRSLRRRIGVVPQSPILFNRSIAENISISLREAGETDRARMEQVASLADAHGFISRLPAGYDTVMGADGASLSLGQIQRLSMARALYQQPEILFCDEPTSALDARSAAEVMRVIERAAESYPVVLVSHGEEARRAAQTLVVLEGGRVRLVGGRRAAAVS
jgi:ABC-type multidrug transport system fused ATPase/permease subunit